MEFSIDFKNKNFSSLLLAYINQNLNIVDINKKVKNFVCAKNQSFIYEKIFDFLSDEEKLIIKRGRNSKFKNKSSKNSTNREYSNATGVESLFGYLFLEKNFNRINELFFIIINFTN